ncbi:hypothetical protein Tco_0157934 [Tanacetum coccineum]
MKAIKNDYDTNVMYDIAKVVGKLQIFVSYNPIDLSTMLIPNDGSLEQAFAGIISEETKKQQESLRLQRELEAKIDLGDSQFQTNLPIKQIVNCIFSSSTMGANPNDVRLTVLMALQEAHDEKSCLKKQMLSLMHRFADRFIRRMLEINRLMTLPAHPLIDYGRHALERMIGADMRNASYLKMARDQLKMARDQLLRSMKEKQEFIKNYKQM